MFQEPDLLLPMPPDFKAVAGQEYPHTYKFDVAIGQNISLSASTEVEVLVFPRHNFNYVLNSGRLSENPYLGTYKAKKPGEVFILMTDLTDVKNEKTYAYELKLS